MRPPRAHRRSIYSATLEPGGILRPHRGCHTRRTDSEGNVLSDVHEPGRPLVANVGDRLVLAHADVAVDEVAVVEVATIYPDGERLVVVPRAGTMPSSERVFVMPGRRAKR